MKRGLTTANAIIVAVIIIGSIFAINLFSSLSGVEDISGDVVSIVGGFCGTKQIKNLFGTTKTYTYTCPSGSSCVNSKCVATTTTPPPTTPTPTPILQTLTIDLVDELLYTGVSEEMIAIYSKTCTSSPNFLSSPSFLSCIDSDGGENDKIAGFTEILSYGRFNLPSAQFAKLNIVVYLNRCLKITQKDYCGTYSDIAGNQIAYVIERTCKVNFPTAVRKDCPKGCSNSACIA